MMALYRVTGAAGRGAAWLVFLAVIGAASVDAAPAAPTAPIIGGIATQVGQYPSVVALRIGSSLCTGTLITPVWVLTAAHCVDPAVLGFTSQDALTAAVRVHFNTVNLRSSDGVVVTATATVKDPAFAKDRVGTNDIGLIKLARPVTEVAPSLVNLDAAMVPVGTVVTLVGYGNTQVKQAGSVGVQFALADRTSVSCPTLLDGTDAALLCFSQADSKGACQGDSGGPAFASIGGVATLVGVTSFGDQDCALFGGSTRADAERAFLVEHVPELVGCDSDDDCGSDRTCFAQRCMVAPFSATGVGATCTSAAGCDSSQCIDSTEGKRCSFTCHVQDTASCPDGFECLSGGGDAGACWPAQSDGGCDTGGAGGSAAMLVGLAAVGLVRRRKRF